MLAMTSRNVCPYHWTIFEYFIRFTFELLGFQQIYTKEFRWSWQQMLSSISSLRRQQHCYFSATTEWLLAIAKWLLKVLNYCTLVLVLLRCLVHYDSLCNLQTSCIVIVTLSSHEVRRPRMTTYFPILGKLNRWP